MIRRSCRWISAVVLALWLGGCTVVNIDGGRVRSVHPGVLRIEAAPDAGLVVVETEGFGVVPGLSGATLGYSRARMAIASDPYRCQVVILNWPEDEEARATLLRLIGETPQVCAVDHGENDDADE